ncbi:MAG: D-3-phosphoglycerate dehydrogenase [Elusimicrobia bacterium]|nr:MAG: D-3-phosphoglycerate dehydrogenase [Elusimicrobiota bacterium]KAF0154098.1 MAG: D-3-phosphoglycerate dehydrogenase [Elusimicrobiota bacterium]
MSKVLIADKADPLCEKTLKDRGIEAVVRTGMKPEELKACAHEFDGIIVRSASRITREIMEAATNLKAVARAGAGVDNIDIPAATEKKVLVMNTPFGNTVSTGEHAIAMMFALARHIPQAHASTHAGKWEKSKFEGVELTDKTLGVVGCGNIGGVVADRARGLKMNVLVFDPAMTTERARELGVKMVTLDELYAKADFITYHVTINPATKGMLNKDAIAKMKKGVRVINCARGGIMVEADVKAAVESGHIAGLAVDVYAEEPATKHIFFGMEKVICTPHIAASTKDAQVTVARQAAEQIADYLLCGKRTHAVNGDKI